VREASRHAWRGVDRRSRRSTEQLDAESLAKLLTMIDSEDYPLMTVGELARALRVPREFIFAHATELEAICLRLRDADGRASAKFERGGPLRFPRCARFALQ
jgi:hypothetical protein